MKRDSKRGISLVVLLITIAVILILAAAVILASASNNPIDKANEAVNGSDFATLQENAALIYSDIILADEELTAQEATDAVREELRKKGYKEEDIIRISITETGRIIVE